MRRLSNISATVAVIKIRIIASCRSVISCSGPYTKQQRHAMAEVCYRFKTASIPESKFISA